jgi:tetratricopeptide (TPR) repeat protein
MQLTLRFGACNESAFAMSTYALILSGVLDDFKGGYRFAQLALFLIERFDAREWFAHVYGVVYSCCIHWRQHVRLCIDPLQMAHRVGMAAGDIEYAMWCAYFTSKHKFFCGQPLVLLEEDMRGYCKLMVEYGQATPLASLATYWQAVMNLLGRSDNALELTGDAMVQDKVLKEANDMNNSFLLQCIRFHRLWLAYILGDYVLASEMADKTRNVKEVSPGVYEVIEHAFYDGLTSSALALKSPKVKKWRIIASSAKAKMKKWATSTPENCLHKYLLLKAESAAMRGRKVRALELYQTAIAAAKKSGFVQDEAIAYERLGLFCMRQGDLVMGNEYMACAHQLYGTWGAVIKENQLEEDFSSISEARSTESFGKFLLARSRKTDEDFELS